MIANVTRIHSFLICTNIQGGNARLPAGCQLLVSVAYLGVHRHLYIYIYLYAYSINTHTHDICFFAYLGVQTVQTPTHTHINTKLFVNDFLVGQQLVVSVTHSYLQTFLHAIIIYVYIYMYMYVYTHTLDMYRRLHIPI